PIALIRWVFGSASYHEIFKYLMVFFGTLYLIKYAVLYLKDKTNEYLLITLSSLFSICYAGVIIVHFNDYNAIIGLHLFGLLLLAAVLWLSAFYLRIYAYCVWAYIILAHINLDFIHNHANLINGHFIFNSINARILFNVC